MLLLRVYRLITKVTQLLLCISCLYSLSSSSWAAEEPLHYLPDIPQKRAHSLIHYMERIEREDEIVSLTGSNQDFYEIFLGDVTGRPQGGVLILHGNQQHGHWPKIVAPLREYLPHHGWTTLTIELPDAPARQRIARQDLTVPSSSSDTEEAFTAVPRNSTITVTFDGSNNVATLTPTGDLSILTTYTATLSTEITDLNGNPLAADYSWSFSTTEGAWGMAEMIEDNAENASTPQIAFDNSGYAIAVWSQNNGAETDPVDNIMTNSFK
jgi:hypothetical protein